MLKQKQLAIQATPYFFFFFFFLNSQIEFLRLAFLIKHAFGVSPQITLLSMISSLIHAFVLPLLLRLKDLLQRSFPAVLLNWITLVFVSTLLKVSMSFQNVIVVESTAMNMAISPTHDLLLHERH